MIWKFNLLLPQCKNLRHIFGQIFKGISLFKGIFENFKANLRTFWAYLGPCLTFLTSYNPFQSFFHFLTISIDFWQFFLSFGLFYLLWAISINFWSFLSPGGLFLGCLGPFLLIFDTFYCSTGYFKPVLGLFNRFLGEKVSNFHSKEHKAQLSVNNR